MLNLELASAIGVEKLDASPMRAPRRNLVHMANYEDDEEETLEIEDSDKAETPQLV